MKDLFYEMRRLCVFGLDEEWRYSSLAELETTCGSLDLAMKRDLDFTPAEFGVVLEPHREQFGG